MDKILLNSSETFSVYGRDHLDYHIKEILNDETVVSFEVVKETKEVKKENEVLEIDYYIIGVLRDLT